MLQFHGEPISTCDQSSQPGMQPEGMAGRGSGVRVEEQLQNPGEVNLAPNRCRSEVFTTFEEARRIREPWVALGQAIGADLFGSFEWCELWWRHFSKGRTLEIHTQWIGDELVGLWPLFREELRIGPLRLSVVRLLGGDHAGTRCFPLVRDLCFEEVISSLLAELERRGPWDVFHIGDLPGYYPRLSALLEALHTSKVGKVFGSQSYYPHAVFHLGDSFERYVEKLSGNERNNIRKSERRLAKTHTLRTRIVGADEIGGFLRNFYKWHDDYWHAQHELGFFTLWPGSREFHAEVARLPGGGDGPILLEVHAGDQPVGLVCGHRFNHRLHLFQVIRAPEPTFESYSPGRLLHCETFRWCLAEGVRTVDAMSGFYEYKRRLGAEYLGLTSVAVVRDDRGSRIRARLFRSVLKLVDAAYFRVWLCRVTPLLRKRFHRMNWKFLYAGMSERFIRWRFLGAALASPLTRVQLDGVTGDE